MASRDYYVVLGVSRTESAPGLRSAFHERVRMLEEADELRAVSEAYQALSNPRRRRQHDEGLRLGEAREARLRGQSGREHAEALSELPPGPSAPWRSAPISLLGDPDSISPSYEALRERLRRNFTGKGVPKSEHLEALNMDLVLAPHEAQRGLALSVSVPTLHTCPDCAGTGMDWGQPCLTCGQAGLVEAAELVPVSIPARVTTGSLVEVPLEGVGIRNLRLRFHVAVSG
jgi:DnaJ-class molecular chaperone